jgi:hypothetical protein
MDLEADLEKANVPEKANLEGANRRRLDPSSP